MPTSNYPYGFAFGVQIRGIPLLQAQTGQVFWVGNGTTLLPNCTAGSDGNPGTYNQPFATLQRGFDMCSANTGDIIVVKSGHAETISNATTLTFNKAGVAVVGLGTGSNRPTFTFSTAATANIPVTKANISIQNCIFVANFADIASVFTATGTNTPTDFMIEQCEFRDTTSVLNFLAIVTGNATANSMDGIWFVWNKIKSLGTTAGSCSIKLLSATDRLNITDNFMTFAAISDLARFMNGASSNWTNCLIARNIGDNKATSTTTVGAYIDTQGTGCTGVCADNYFWHLDNSTGIWIRTGTGLGMVQNFSPISAVADKSAVINPATA